MKEVDLLMNGVDIRKKIDANNLQIERLLAPNVFTLNNTIAKLLKENAELQAKCVHVFQDGYCIFCDMEEVGEYGG